MTPQNSSGTSGPSQRYILAIDNSASMSATDIAAQPPRSGLRLEALKVGRCDGGSEDLAMIIAFSDRAKVVSSYSGNKPRCSRHATRRPSGRLAIDDLALRDALQVAAGLANPTRQDRQRRFARRRHRRRRSSRPSSSGLHRWRIPRRLEGISLGHLEPASRRHRPAAPGARPRPRPDGPVARPKPLAPDPVR